MSNDCWIDIFNDWLKDWMIDWLNCFDFSKLTLYSGTKYTEFTKTENYWLIAWLIDRLSVGRFDLRCSCQLHSTEKSWYDKSLFHWTIKKYFEKPFSVFSTKWEVQKKNQWFNITDVNSRKKKFLCSTSLRFHQTLPNLGLILGLRTS